MSRKERNIMESIYLDHAATTPLHPDVLMSMYRAHQDTFGNPSSIHAFGRKARQHLDKARRTLAASIHANEKEIIFTSGGTEANNLALIGVALANKHRGKHIITSKQEHHATLHAAEYLESIGFNVTYLPVDEKGLIHLEELKNALTDETIIVSLMDVNNETGVKQPIEEIGDILRNHKAYFHTDAVAAFGLLDFNVETMGIDLLTISSRKINGPKGVGCLYIKDEIPLQSLHFGGEQERKRRPGTENVVGVIGFKRAVEITLEEKNTRQTKYEQYKNKFLQVLQNEDVDFSINGDLQISVPTIVNISFPRLNVETLLTNFDLEGIAASSGSACTAGSVEPSHVLLAMYGHQDERTKNSVRFSFGSHNTLKNIEEAARRIAKIIHRLKTTT